MNTQQQQRATIAAFHAACNDLAEAVNRQLFEGGRTPYWVADDIGGICDFEDTDVLSPEDMVRILQAGMTYDEYAEWRDANADNSRYINLKSWLKGLRHDMIDSHPKEPLAQAVKEKARQEFLNRSAPLKAGDGVVQWLSLLDLLPKKRK